jgi:hypothetical protein
MLFVHVLAITVPVRTKNSFMNLLDIHYVTGFGFKWVVLALVLGIIIISLMPAVNSSRFDGLKWL